jgi:hypothetical protein
MTERPVPAALRQFSTYRECMGGCFVCWGSDAQWTGPNAQALAARHHDSTGHNTWADIQLQVRYGA